MTLTFDLLRIKCQHFIRWDIQHMKSWLEAKTVLGHHYVPPLTTKIESSQRKNPGEPFLPNLNEFNKANPNQRHLLEQDGGGDR